MNISVSAIKSACIACVFFQALEVGSNCEANHAAEVRSSGRTTNTARLARRHLDERLGKHKSDYMKQ